MEFERIFGSGGWPPPPSARSQESFLRLSRWVLLGILALFAFNVLSLFRSFLVDLLWLESLGYLAVFYTRLWAELVLFLLGLLLLAALYLANYWVAERVARRLASPIFLWVGFVSLRRPLSLGMAGLGLFLGLIFASLLAQRWESVLLLFNARPFDVADPLFGLDVAFYIFVLPVLSYLQGWAVGIAVALLLVTAGYYGVHVLLRGQPYRLPPLVVAHLSALGAILLLLFALGHGLQLPHLNFSSRGALYGAGWTDVHVTVWTVGVQILAALVGAALLLLNVFRRSVRLPLWALGLWLGVLILIGGIIPAAAQRLLVEPNELQRELPYLRSHIEMTRKAYDLEKVEVRAHPGSAQVTPELVLGNSPTISNIRIWDTLPLKDTYNQIQFLRLYYEFSDVDNDRYWIDGQYRQVMLASRALMQERLPGEAQGWYNRQLQYTHGYGVVMSPVNEVDREGLPLLFLKDVPLVGKLPLQRPEVYFGEQTKEYVVVRTKAQEFDYPVGDTNVYSVYAGADGLPIAALWRRLLFAWELNDLNLLFSDQFTAESRVLIRRLIQERIRRIAPFLRLDPDPYITVVDGRLYWIQDAYTVSRRYPYSQPSVAGLNYIRNSVKVIVDAYHGTTTFYIADPRDPLVQAYQSVFPTLFQPLEAMPPGLREHIRYPTSLFTVQANIYRTYHMTDPHVFYNREDLWGMPREIFAGNEQPMRAYYVIMRLPEAEKEEFLLILPFTPMNKENSTAWLAGRSDGPYYGELLAFVFPKDRNVYGPMQIEARINQDPDIQSQFTLWSTGGHAEILRGNLLMIPLGDALIYVKPVYLQSAAASLPQLKAVIIATSDRLVMEPTIEQSLARLLGQPVMPGVSIAGLIPATAAGVSEVARLTQQAWEQFQRAQASQRAGDWAGYGQSLQELGRLLERLAALGGSSFGVPPSP